jgi:hypothetical protein
MTFRKFFGLAFLLWFLLFIEKVIFLRVFSFSGWGMSLTYGILLVILTLSCVRRLGIINYLEALLALFVWFAIIVILDYIALSAIMDINYYGTWQIWAGYFAMMLAIFFFHKKRHVAIRRELAEKHGHH